MPERPKIGILINDPGSRQGTDPIPEQHRGERPARAEDHDIGERAALICVPLARAKRLPELSAVSDQQTRLAGCSG